MPNVLPQCDSREEMIGYVALLVAAGGGRRDGSGIGWAVVRRRKRRLGAAILLGYLAFAVLTEWALWHQWSWRWEALGVLLGGLVCMSGWLMVLMRRRWRIDTAAVEAEHAARKVDLAARQVLLDAEREMRRNDEL
jgi:hypothetical protein